jgi:hypothetical protein
LKTDESATNELIFRNCCRTCGQTKPPEDFYHDRRAASGRQASCKECQKQRAAAWQRAHPDRHRAHVSSWKASHPDQVRHYDGLARSRRDQVARDFARLVVRVASTTRRAVEAGLLVRPDRCSSCDRSDVALDAVHEDYERPLDVLWLCRRCHYSRSLARRRATGDNS